MIANRWSVAIVLGVMVLPSLALAQSEDSQLAQTLFDEGLKLMDAGKYTQACPKLAESQKLDPGGGTLINLALCREKEGRLASAWAAYNDALSMSIKDGRKERENAARERLADITPKLAKLTIVVPSSAPPNLEVRFDNAPVRQAAWGIATPVDIGKHELSAIAPGKKPWKTSFDIMANGEVKSVDVPPLEDAPVEVQQNTNNTGVVAPPPPVNNTAAWVAGGIGVASLVAGVITGALVLSKKAESDNNCKSGCNQQGVDAMKSAYTLSWVSDIGLGLGVLGLGVSAILFLTNKPSPPASASAQSAWNLAPFLGPTSAGIRGAF